MYFIPDDRPTGPDNRPAGLETARDLSFGIPRGPLLARLSAHIAAGIRCLVVLVVALRFALGGRTACRPLTVDARDAFEFICSTPFVPQDQFRRLHGRGMLRTARISRRGCKMPVRFEAAMLLSHRECSLQSCRVPNGVVSGEEGCQNLLTPKGAGNREGGTASTGGWRRSSNAMATGMSRLVLKCSCKIAACSAISAGRVSDEASEQALSVPGLRGAEGLPEPDRRRDEWQGPCPLPGDAGTRP